MKIDIPLGLYVPEGHCAVLHTTGQANLFRIKYKPHSDTIYKNCTFQLKSQEGIRNLFTDGIMYCMGLMLIGESSYGLIHANSAKSLELLLKRVLFDLPERAIHAMHACSSTGMDNPANNYLEVLSRITPTIVPRIHQQPIVYPQEIACGKDVLYTGSTD
ncbi:MAG: hypothetical protein Q8N99_04395 [Nanoarchaeota archaeon]|nr:hypothetical protein [Nanoarchaeota archaeon]